MFHICNELFIVVTRVCVCMLLRWCCCVTVGVIVQIPLTMDEMIDSTVEQFNELLSKYQLSDAQNQLIRDIRRRGKNKLAAQNCRKRKLEVIQTVEDEVRQTSHLIDIRVLSVG